MRSRGERLAANPTTGSGVRRSVDSAAGAGLRGAERRIAVSRRRTSAFAKASADESAFAKASVDKSAFAKAMADNSQACQARASAMTKL
ncbi:MAG TPA: hypothetical protein VII56_07930 [Rhizomicrobium sp.]